jgi:type I restriction enzyme S subunit
VREVEDEYIQEEILNGFDVSVVFNRRDADYYEFKPEVESKESIRDVIGTDNQKIIAQFERWWDKYKVSLHELDAQVEEAEAVMKGYLGNWGMSEGVPEGWESSTLSKFATIKGGKRVPKGRPFAPRQTEFPYIRVSDFKNGTISFADIRYVFKEDWKKIKRYNISKDDLYISIAGTLGFVGDIPVKLDGALFTENAAKIAIKNPKSISKTYLKYYLSSEEPQKHFLHSKGTGGGVPKLALFRIEDTPVVLPTLIEQQKIAAILTSVDDVIEKTEAQINKLQDLKKGMMQELLTKGIGHTEFKDSPVGRIPKDWDVVELNHLASIRHGFAFFGEYFSTERTEYTLLTPGNFHRDGHLYFGDNTKYFTGEIPEDFVLNNGDVLVVMTDLTKEMTILGNSVVLNTDRTVLHNQRIGKLQILKQMKSRISSSYLNLILNSFYVKNHVKNTATGTTVRHTSPTKILEPLIPLPPFAEQEDIVRVLESIQNDLVLSEEKKEAVQLLKKALMQDLLTGKVRVNVD